MLALVEPVRFSQAHFHSMHNTNLRGKTVISLLGVRVAIILSKTTIYNTINPFMTVFTTIYCGAHGANQNNKKEEFEPSY